MLQQQTKKQTKKPVKITKTCLQAPWEYKLQVEDQTLDHLESQQLVEIMTSQRQITNLKVGSRIALRKLRQKNPIQAIVLVLDKEILELILQIILIAKRNSVPIILLHEAVLPNLKSLFKVQRYHCCTIMLTESPQLGEALKQGAASTLIELPYLIPDNNYLPLRIN